MFCGSDGSFDPDCDHIPFGAEDCAESWQEIEEEEEMRDGGGDSSTSTSSSETLDLQKFGGAANDDEDGQDSGFGGSGAIGAMNPSGGIGRDHPEATATINRDNIPGNDRADPPSTTTTTIDTAENQERATVPTAIEEASWATSRFMQNGAVFFSVVVSILYLI